MKDKKPTLVITCGQINSNGDIYQKGCFGDSLDTFRDKGYNIIEQESPAVLENNLPPEKIHKMSDFELHFHKVRLEKEIWKRHTTPS